MRSLRAFLSVGRMDANSTAGRTVGKYLRYIHYRDQVQQGDEGRGLTRLVRYVAHRDRVSPESRLFTSSRTVGDRERRALAAYVSRSTQDLMGRKGRPLTAAYRFVLSPEDARGLDLRKVTRTVMAQLDRDMGGALPWVAAEHRNTAHPHVHILMAARLELEPGTLRGVKITRERLARMKLAMGREMLRQRGDRQLGLELQTSLTGPGSGSAQTGRFERRLPPVRPRTQQHTLSDDPMRWRPRRATTRQRQGLSWFPLERALGRLATHYRRQMERETREEMRRRARSGREHHEEREWEVYE